jgi:hypothetical protein
MHQVQAQYMVKGAGGGEYGFGVDQTQQATTMQHRNKSGDHREIEKDSLR